ncbi:MAG: hypothetical protein R3B13_40525 [Polyangiaceae bacterium]
MKTALSMLVLGATLATSGSALAQAQGQWGGTYQPTMPRRSSSIDNLGEEMQFVFGVDGVMGVDFARDKLEPTGGESTSKTTSINLFGGGAAGLPRLALDYFVMEGLSVGGSFIFMTSSNETETSAGGTSATVDGGSTRTLALHPRIGYAIPFDETFSIWPRGGIMYVNNSTTPGDPPGGGAAGPDTTDTATMFTLEAMVGISPFSHFAILVGPYLYLGIGGKVEQPTGANTTQEIDRTLTAFGLTTSIVGYY